MPAAKDTIYIDVDDEITTVIDKMQAAKSSVVALVLPKRAAVFQSIVNMKLLKRSAASAQKNIVLITSEATVLPLAGAVGLHVAKTLQSKPEIPATPNRESANIPEEVSLEETAAVSAAKPAVPADEPPANDDTPIEIDNDEAPEPKAAKQQFNKKLKVPSFDKFRNKLGLGIAALVLLIAGWVFAAVVLPRASVTITTNSTDVQASIAVTTSPLAKELDKDKNIVPGILKELKKTDSQKAPATGQKDMGEKAKGSVSMSAKTTCSPGMSIPAGTTVSSGNFSFVTQVPAVLEPIDVDDGKCIYQSGSVAVVADKAGDGYNLSARDYTVAGFTGVTAKGTVMGGGTSKIIKVVSQQDIDTLKQKITDALNGPANKEIADQLKNEGYFPLNDTFVAKDPLVVSSPAVDAESGEVTVNVSITYTMVGARQDALKELLEASIKTQIDTDKQTVLNDGLDSAAIRIDNRQSNGITSFTLQTTATAGVAQDEADIKQSIVGKKKSEVESILLTRPGVEQVKVDYSPFWVYKVPSKEGKITLVFEQQSSDQE